jgi:hypothetical protein
MHEDRFRECWKCASPEHSTQITAEAPKLPPPAPALRSPGSILMRVVVAFVVGMIAAMAIFHRSGVPIETAAEYGLYLGGGLAFLVGVFFWILFPYQPSRDAEVPSEEPPPHLE